MKYTNDQALEILAEASLPAGGGECGETAIAINRVLFGGKGEYVAVANKYLFEQKNRFAGHVGVRVGDDVWDAEGVWENEPEPEDFLAWGMLDPEDPDYGFPTEEDAYEVVLLDGLTEDEVRDLLPECSLLDSFKHLKKIAEGYMENPSKLKAKLLR